MALSPALSIPEISALLKEMDEGELAGRLDYLASDEDLDAGDVPATSESARGFFELFSSVECDSKVGLGCSPEGWIVGEWRWFPDERGASVWFLGDERLMFSANKKNGGFVSIGEQRRWWRKAYFRGVRILDAQIVTWRAQRSSILSA